MVSPVFLVDFGPKPNQNRKTTDSSAAAHPMSNPNGSLVLSRQNQIIGSSAALKTRGLDPVKRVTVSLLEMQRLDEATGTPRPRKVSHFKSLVIAA
jgi:hypothetical protein